MARNFGMAQPGRLSAKAPLARVRHGHTIAAIEGSRVAAQRHTITPGRPIAGCVAEEQGREQATLPASNLPCSVRCFASRRYWPSHRGSKPEWSRR